MYSSCRRQSTAPPASSMHVLISAISLLLFSLTATTTTTTAFQPPVLGIGSVLFPVRGRLIESLAGDVAVGEAKRQALQQASDFFVQAFWTGKVGGGSKELSDKQLRTLEQSQLAEFTKRYGGSSSSGRGSGNRYKRSDLLLCRVPSLNEKNKKDATTASQNSMFAYRDNNDIVACAGVEIDIIPSGSLKGPILARAPLMSNLAVSRQFRRRGLAEDMVQAVEDLVKDDWGFDECYLYVELRNKGAVRLYQKLGYRAIWQDGTATTLLPTEAGDLQSSPTVIICMKKDLSKTERWPFF